RGFSKENMGPPPIESALAGRLNSEGESILYLSDSEETTLYEVRACMGDFVTIGSFKLKEDIEVINISLLDKISPYQGISNGFDFTQYAINIEHLRMICGEISKPQRKHDKLLDYVPTQYISDFIKSRLYCGIEFHSTICSHGSNFAIFESCLFTCTKVKTTCVTSIVYSYSG
ncbi:MAG TPA: RES family NAD+ phosphorylase, partial [Candidatus Cryosericum sp.]|nr:RES family NAD+ phosphorylase [Candidatus Cryosericum sp.]